MSTTKYSWEKSNSAIDDYDLYVNGEHITSIGQYYSTKMYLPTVSYRSKYIPTIDTERKFRKLEKCQEYVVDCYKEYITEQYHALVQATH